MLICSTDEGGNNVLLKVLTYAPVDGEKKELNLTGEGMERMKGGAECWVLWYMFTGWLFMA